MNAVRSSRLGRGLAVDWLVDSDIDVLRTLALVRTASSDHLRRLHFTEGSERACQRALARLSRERLITRLTRRVGGVCPGSSPWAYSLAIAGQRMLGVAGPRGGRVRRPWVPSPMFLRHALLITEVYVCAMEVGRDHGRPLLRFATEPDCWRRLAYYSMVKPDAELWLGGPGYEDHYFVEADCATEGPRALARKLALYRKHFQSGVEQETTGVFPRVLFVTLDERRRAQLAAETARQPNEFRPIFSVTALGELHALLLWGGDG